MERDREEIVNIISEMLDNPDEIGIFPTGDCFNQLEEYVETIRHETIGWMYAYACNLMDEEKDIRELEVPVILEQALIELE